MAKNGAAEQLRAAIRKSGMTRYAIAKAAKMPQSQVGRVASGESDPTIGTAERIARAIGVKIMVVAK